MKGTCVVGDFVIIYKRQSKNVQFYSFNTSFNR